MIVDGTTHQAAAVSTQQKPVNGVSKLRPARNETGQEESRSVSSNTPQDTVRASTGLRDSFEHVSEAVGAAAYGNSVAGRDTDGVVGGAFEAARELLDQPQDARIVDLETAVNATGLPLLPESDGTGVLTQDVLRAYGTAGTRTDKSVQDGLPVDLLDTLG